MTAQSLIPDGVVAFVKRACPTCTLIEKQMQQAARRLPQFQVVSQKEKVPGVFAAFLLHFASLR